MGFVTMNLCQTSFELLLLFRNLRDSKANRKSNNDNNHFSFLLSFRSFLDFSCLLFNQHSFFTQEEFWSPPLLRRLSPQRKRLSTWVFIPSLIWFFSVFFSLHRWLLIVSFSFRWFCFLYHSCIYSPPFFKFFLLPTGFSFLSRCFCLIHVQFDFLRFSYSVLEFFGCLFSVIFYLV